MSSRATTAHAHADPNSAGSDAVLLRLVGMVQSLGEELQDVRQAQQTMEGELADIKNSQSQVRQAQDRAAEQMGQVQQAQKTMEGELADIKNSQSQVQQAQKTMEGELADIKNSQSQVRQAQETMEGELADIKNSQSQVRQAQETMEGELADIKNSQSQVQRAQDRAAEQMGQVQQAQKTMEGELADIKNSQSQVRQAQEDMKKLLLEAKKTMEGQHATTLNEELAWTVCRNGNAVSVAEVNALLDRGADLYRYQLPRPFRAATAAPCRRPALHALIALGHLEAVEAVMAHPRVVDLTSVDELGCSPLHVLASACPGEDAKVADMLAAMLARDRDPSMKTVVDWAQEGACRDGQRLDF
eukprot:gene12741-biopygen9348